MFSKLALAFSIFLLIINVDSRGGVGGGGRGSSGARSSSSSFSSSSASRGSASSTSSRTSGGGGYSSSSPYRSSAHATNLRQNVFHTTSTTTMFSYSPIYRSNVILMPSTPFIYGGYHYYWGGHYSYAAERPKQCDYTVTNDDEEFSNVTYSNGSHVSQISFGCRSDQNCCNLECCSRTSILTWIIVGLVTIGLLSMFIWACYTGKCNQDSVVVIPDVAQTTVITRTYTTQQTHFAPPVPPPPGWEPCPPGYAQGPPPAPPQYNPSAPSKYPNAMNNRPMSSSHIQPVMMKY